MLIGLPLVSWASTERGEYKINPTKDPSSPTKIYIPKNIYDCLAELKKMLPPDVIAEIKGLKSEKEMVQYHFDLGRWIRNFWGLWGGSRLSHYFKDQGMNHPDDMSSLVLVVLWRDLNGKPLRIKEEYLRYRKFSENKNCNIDPELAALENKDPIVDAKNKIKQKDLQVLGIFGLSMTIPGISGNPYCWQEKMKVRIIKDTGDVLRCAEHQRLQGVAVQYATKYNGIIFNFLPDEQKNACN